MLTRNLKRKLKRENDIADSQLSKNTLYLKELRAQREAVQKYNRQVESRIEFMGEEKEALKNQHYQHSKQIENTSKQLQHLKHEIENVKGLITTLGGDKSSTQEVE